MVHLITLLAIICVAYSPGALSIWLSAAHGVGCIKVEGKPLCESTPDAIGSPDARYVNAETGKVNINIEFGFDATDAQRPPAYNQVFSFDIPTGMKNFVFTEKFCIAERDNPNVGLVCYDQDNINFRPSENPYITTNWNGRPPKPPSVKGTGAGAASPQSRLGTYDPNLEASNIFFTDQQQEQEQQTGSSSSSSSSPVWIQTPENNPDDLAQLAFEFPNPYSIPEDPWV